MRKLLPPLTDIIRTTPAMSLLYECINGIIQGGILGSDDDDDISGREEIASLCVSKLRGMIMVHDDPNCECLSARVPGGRPWDGVSRSDIVDSKIRCAYRV